MGVSVTARLSDSEVREIDALVKAGNFLNRSDFLRFAAKHVLHDEAPMIPKALLDVQEELRDTGVRFEDMDERLRTVRRQLYGETYGDD